MRPITIVAVATFALFTTAAANAADIARPVHKAPGLIPPAVGFHNWSGFYVGGQVGGAFSESDWATDATLNGLFVNNVHSKDNWIAGGQVGLRHQWGNWVLGVEGMWSATDLQTSQLSGSLDVLGFPNRFRGTDIDQIYSVTGQLGYAWDRWLAYVKGGWAGASVELSTLNANNGVTSSVSGNANGWTIGGGAEYAFAPNWSFAIEYNYYDLAMGDKSTTQTNGIAANYIDHDVQIHTVMARVNYTFDWGKNPGPVMANY